MMEAIITSNGKLKKKFQPAIYFDSSVLIDYWIAEGLDRPKWFPKKRIHWGEEYPVDEMFRSLLKSDVRINKVAEIRRKIRSNDVKATPVTSYISYWELEEWFAESFFKQRASAVAGAFGIQKKGKKQIGDYIKKAYELWSKNDSDPNSQPSEFMVALEQFMDSIFINPSFAEFHGLNGILCPEIVNFSLPPKKSHSIDSFVDPSILAVLQLGSADIFMFFLQITFNANILQALIQIFVELENSWKKRAPYS